MRHFFCIDVFLYRGVWGGAQRLEKQSHFILLDQASNLLDGARRAVAIVIGDEVNLPTTDAALVVHHPEEGGVGLADHAIGRSRAGIRAGMADFELGRGNAGRGLRPRLGRSDHGTGNGGGRGQKRPT